MPWKNGGGQTLELFKCLNEEGEILLRLSMATIEKAGPFSSFPGIDRHLIVLEGHCLFLKMGNRNISIKKNAPPLTFAGEELIWSDPLSSPIVDFNVMIKRSWGKAQIEYLSGAGQTLRCEQDMLFIYSPSEKILRLLTKGEETVITKHDELSIKVQRLLE